MIHHNFLQVSLALLMGAFLGTIIAVTDITTQPAVAQQWIPSPSIQQLYAPEDITCTNAYNYTKEAPGAAQELKKKQYEACKDGYKNHDTANYCVNKNYGSSPEGTAQTSACSAGVTRHGDPGIKFCAARHAIGIPTDPKNTLFNACYDGFKNGEGPCNIHHPASDTSKKPLRDACLEGVKGGIYNQGAASSAATSADMSQSSDVLGTAPNSANISDLMAGKNEVATREKCSIEGFFGSIVCDFLNVLGRTTDASLALLGSFMKVEPLTTKQDDPIYSYWKIFRTIANVSFIIALLVIVLSHMSGLGLSAYNVQKMVPRLVVGAMLINVSFFACAAAVDVSNIVGSTVYGTMKNAVAPQPAPGAPATNEDPLQVEMTPTTLVNPSDNTELSWSYLVSMMSYVAPSAAVVGTGAVLGAGMLMNGGLAALIPVIIGAALAIIIVVLCLLIRQALIIIFIVISPLAFAAFLLPNTKSLFDRWVKSFIPLLMLFPVIAFVFGIGAVVSEIMLAAALTKTHFISKSLFMLVALAVQVIPLLAVPKLMAMGGGLLAQLANASRAKTDGLNSKSKEYAQKQKKLGDKKATTNPHWYNKHRRMRADSEIKNKLADQSLEHAQTSQTDAYKTAEAGPQLPEAAPSEQPTAPTPSIPGPEAETVEATADETPTTDETTSETTTDIPSEIPRPEGGPVAESTTIDEAAPSDGYDAETAKEVHIAATAKAARVSARSAQFGSEHTSRDDVLAIATLKDAAVTNTDIEGAITNLASVGDIGAIMELLKVSDRMNPSQRQTLVKSIKESGAGSGAAPMLKNPEVLENIQNGRVNASTIGSTVIAPSLRKDDYSPETMANLDQDMAKEVLLAVQNPQANGLADHHVSDIVNATDTALRSDSTARRVSKQRDSLVAIQALRRPPNAS